jgi:hypothetical protein
VTGRQAGRCGVRLPAGARDSRFSKTPTPALRLTQPPNKSVPGDFFLGVNRPGREADHSPRLRMSVPVPLLPLHALKQEQQGQHLFTYFLIIIIVLFSCYIPITSLPKFETYGETRGQYMVMTLGQSFPYKNWKRSAVPHKKVPEKQFSSHFAAGGV